MSTALSLACSASGSRRAAGTESHVNRKKARWLIHGSIAGDILKLFTQARETEKTRAADAGEGVVQR